MNQNNIFLVGKDKGETVFKSLSFDAHQTPVFADDKKHDWVEYGTAKSVGKEYKNNYPLYLVNLYNSSPTHNAILNEKTNFIVGQGWVVDNENLSLEERVKLNKWIKHPNKSESLEDLTRKIALDKKLYGGYSVEIILDTNNNIAEIYHIDFGNLRRDKEDRDKFYFTSNWAGDKKGKPEQNEDFETLYSFPWDKDKIDANKRYIVYIKEYRPNQKEYPLPDYVASNPYIEADYEISNFVLNNTKNGFTAGFVANFYNGQPSPEAKTAIDKEFDNMFTGSDQAGKVLKNFSEGKEYGLELTPISPNGQDDRYTNLEKTVTHKIFIGHQMPPALIDSVSQVTGLGNNADEKRASVEQYQSSYVDKEQMQLENLMNSVVGYNELPERLEIVKIKPPKIQFTENMLMNIYDRNELREMDGAKPTEEQTTVSRVEMKSNTDSLLKLFKSGKFGIDREKIETIKKKQNPILDIDSAFAFESDFKFISNEDAALLNLIKANVPNATIARALDISTDELNTRIQDLEDQGIIEDGEVVETPEVDEEFFIVYTYELRNDAPPLKTKSRDFCIEMVELSQTRVFTLEDIQQISAIEGRDVFKTRGGWYHNPDTGVNTPWCRHIWAQELVRRK